jgi:MFS family permease
MIAEMSMSPLFMQSGHQTIRVIGLTLSAHVFAMYAFAPLFGMLYARLGPRRSLMLSFVLLEAACLAGAVIKPERLVSVIVALMLLGLGWSLALVASSNAQAGISTRGAQGRGDLILNGAGVLAVLVGGALVATVGFNGLCLVFGGLILGAHLLTRQCLVETS